MSVAAQDVEALTVDKPRCLHGILGMSFPASGTIDPSASGERK